jgi:hypothetical protein
MQAGSHMSRAGSNLSLSLSLNQSGAAMAARKAVPSASVFGTALFTCRHTHTHTHTHRRTKNKRWITKPASFADASPLAQLLPSQPLLYQLSLLNQPLLYQLSLPTI